MPQQKPIKWKLVTKKVSELKPYSKNPRNITEQGLKDLKKSVDKFGLAELITINTNNIIIGGHARWQTLKANGTKECDCLIPNRKLNDKEVEELNIRLNKNIAGTWDFDILANEFDMGELLEWGFTDKELVGVDFGGSKTDEELDDAPEPQKEAISKLGDIFLIGGKHRVMCGDSTKREDVELLMDGKKADMVFTDPPYNVDYEGGLSDNNGKGLKSNKREKIKNDAVDLYPLVIPIMAEYCNGAIYTWFAGTKGKTVYEAIDQCGQIHSLIIWVKNGGYGALAPDQLLSLANKQTEYVTEWN